ncbi:hypothetical protein [Methanococcoides burtonii]|uniref:Uncharacterized protein n=1 Tax=Methanococcoides burtonii (strain DSM 6242 / NBRC 107633 / OCM 468 / ACE-M) TaxID=259564 RepID=Q12YH7_METBU|nr:hypothetical protein [Methanococcoides burtonii]ABE51499.1 Hypothetical protein Mbur_0517 [Methanococcoides burtonii DSM 6242]
MKIVDDHGLKPGTIRTYKRMVKKFFRVLGNGDTKEELDKIMNACGHPRDKAMIAVLADSGMRSWCIGFLSHQHAEFNQYGAILYISQTSKIKKTTNAKKPMGTGEKFQDHLAKDIEEILF